jgi:hypothetical protein
MESFACRALRKPEEVSCLHCGGGLGHAQYCPACGVIYPDYIYASLSRRQVRKVREKFSLKERLFPGPVVRKGPSPQVETRKSEGARPGAVAALQKYRTKMLGALALVVVVSLGAYFYLQHSARQKYAVEYVRVLYGMKAGGDLGLKVSSKLASDWKANMDAGRADVPRISADDETKLVRIKGEVDAVMKQIATPPNAFAEAHGKLTGFYGVYQRIHSASVKPSGAWATYNDALVKLDNDFRKSAANLKGALPEQLAEALKEGKLKYKGLRDF